MYDPATKSVRKSWAFVMTLAWSRHQYVQFVFDQRVETWLMLHRQAFEAFGGVPRRIKLDNLKAAIVKACVDDPQVQRAYRECADTRALSLRPVASPPLVTRVKSNGHKEPTWTSSTRQSTSMRLTWLINCKRGPGTTTMNALMDHWGTRHHGRGGLSWRIRYQRTNRYMPAMMKPTSIRRRSTTRWRWRCGACGRWPEYGLSSSRKDLRTAAE